MRILLPHQHPLFWIWASSPLKLGFLFFFVVWLSGCSESEPEVSVQESASPAQTTPVQVMGTDAADWRAMSESGAQAIEQSQFANAERLLLSALEIADRLEPEVSGVRARTYLQLGDLYQKQNQLELAREHYEKASELWNSMPEDRREVFTDLVARTSRSLADTLTGLGRTDLAERRYKMALQLWEQQGGTKTNVYAQTENSLGLLYARREQYELAEPYFHHALQTWESLLGASHPSVATALNNLAGTYKYQEKFAEAEKLYLRSLGIKKEKDKIDPTDLAKSYNNLAQLYDAQGDFDRAEPFYVDAIQAWESALLEDHPIIELQRRHYAAMLYDMGRDEDAVHIESGGDLTQLPSLPVPEAPAPNDVADEVVATEVEVAEIAVESEPIQTEAPLATADAGTTTTSQ